MSDVQEAPAQQAFVSDSRTYARAWQDLRDGFAMRQLWLHLGWQDIKQRYRRSVLGPFWITIATAVSTAAMGFLYGTLFHNDLRTFFPHVAIGFIFWNLISASILEGSEVFVANEGLIKQLPTPLSVHVYRLVWRQLLFLLHNFLIVVVVLIIFPPHWSWTALLFIPGLALVVVNAVWVSLVFGILATRFRDIAPLVGSLVQLLFFITPVIWTPSTLTEHGAGWRVKLIEINPLFHFLDVVRAPLMGEPIDIYRWGIVIGITIVGWIAAFIIMKRYRSRVSYWV